MKDLEERVRQHNSEALAELLEHYRPRLSAFIAKNMSHSLRQKVDAEDILQETSISCVGSLEEIDFTNREPFDWVCHVARRRIMDAGRRFSGSQKRDVKREVGIHGDRQDGQAGIVDLLVASITSPSRAFSRDQKEFRLWNAFEQLPEESRQAIEMRYVQSLPTKEIALKLGKSDGAVRVLLTRTLKKLETLLNDDGEDSLPPPQR